MALLHQVSQERDGVGGLRITDTLEAQDSPGLPIHMPGPLVQLEVSDYRKHGQKQGEKGKNTC